MIWRTGKALTRKLGNHKKNPAGKVAERAVSWGLFREKLVTGEGWFKTLKMKLRLQGLWRDLCILGLIAGVGVGLFGPTLSELLGRPAGRARELAQALIQQRIDEAVAG